MDSADRKEVAELINLIIKSWWEKNSYVSIDTGNGIAQSFQIKNLLQIFFKTDNYFEQERKRLERKLTDLGNRVTERESSDFILDCINMWWKNKASLYMTRDEVQPLVSQNIRNFVQDAQNTTDRLQRGLNGLVYENKKLSEKTASNEERIEALMRNQQQNIIKADIPHFVSQNIENFVQEVWNTTSRLQSRLDELADENRKLEEEIAFLKRRMSAQQTPKSVDYSNTQKMNTQQSADSSSSDQIVATFNRWAKNPMASLPSQFRYAEGGLKLREKQEIKHCNDDKALWIVNTSGPTKYLFPNPNSIDQIAGDIDVLYSVTGTRRAKGQNKVEIQKPCVITNNNDWIEYKGTLSLI